MAADDCRRRARREREFREEGTHARVATVDQSSTGYVREREPAAASSDRRLVFEQLAQRHERQLVEARDAHVCVAQVGTVVAAQDGNGL